jgi:hypothetical protein
VANRHESGTCAHENVTQHCTPPQGLAPPLGEGTGADVGTGEAEGSTVGTGAGVDVGSEGNVGAAVGNADGRGAEGGNGHAVAIHAGLVAACQLQTMTPAWTRSNRNTKKEADRECRVTEPWHAPIENVWQPCEGIECAPAIAVQFELG